MAHAVWLAHSAQHAAASFVVALGMPTSTESLQMKPVLTLKEGSHVDGAGDGAGDGGGGGVGGALRPPLILSPCFGLVGVAVAFRRLQLPGPVL